ncbi:hypothetical protein MUK42_05779 [Musa troglodytarum]|uniref:Uncharacterized protein n=1 Tax=Musa troglodytarum TaxID=320322 RepID=A0A9E7EMZ3_9LILI|nr:hypothetical protein MUK42_05779 [Musa troglodytarum]
MAAQDRDSEKRKHGGSATYRNVTTNIEKVVYHKWLPSSLFSSSVSWFYLLLYLRHPLKAQLRSQNKLAYISGYHANRMVIVSGHAHALVLIRHASLKDVVALHHNAKNSNSISIGN